MFQKNARFERATTAIVCVGLVALTIVAVFALATNQLVGLPIVLLLLVAWGGMFLLQVVLPIVAVIQFLVWLNHKLFSHASSLGNTAQKSGKVERFRDG